MRKLLLIAAVLTFGSPLNAMTEQSLRNCRQLVKTVSYMALGGATLEIMNSRQILPTNSLKDGSAAANKQMLKNMLVEVYYRIGGYRAGVRKNDRFYDHISYAQKDFCEGGQGTLWFK